MNFGRRAVASLGTVLLFHHAEIVLGVLVEVLGL